MSCYARVVVKATVEIEGANLDLSRADMGSKYVLRIGPEVTLEIDKATGRAELRSTASTWDEGVRQLNNTIKYLQGKGAIVKDVGKPETHRHDHVGPWQKGRVS